MLKIGKGRTPTFAECGQVVTEVTAGILPEGKKRGTVTEFPVGSRTTVPELTQVGLTSGFGMGPGKHHRYDRAPIFFRIGSGCDPAFGSLRKLA
tara:strand:- start:46 stop:327 length:282 start_codon:yes stop_codon:yes gene_type:complete